MTEPVHEADMTETEVVIIGAGHNGLTCAAYLAMAGLRVKVVERRKVVGGAAVTEEFHPGFRNSVAAYTVSLLNPRIISDLKLGDHFQLAREGIDAAGIARAEFCHRRMSAAFAGQEIAAIEGGEEILRAAFDDPQAMIAEL